MLPPVHEALETKQVPATARQAAATVPQLWCSRPNQRDVPGVCMSADSHIAADLYGATVVGRVALGVHQGMDADETANLRPRP
jgi:hypothetical protein